MITRGLDSSHMTDLTQLDKIKNDVQLHLDFNANDS